MVWGNQFLRLAAAVVVVVVVVTRRRLKQMQFLRAFISRLPFMYVYMHYTADFVKEKIFFFKIIFSGALPVGRNSASRIRRRVNAPIPKRSVF